MRELRRRRAVATAAHLAFVVAVVPLVPASVIFRVRTPRIPRLVRPHGEVAECLRVIVGGIVLARGSVPLPLPLVVVLVLGVIILVLVMVVVVPAVLMMRVARVGVVVSPSRAWLAWAHWQAVIPAGLTIRRNSLRRLVGGRCRSHWNRSTGRRPDSIGLAGRVDGHSRRRGQDARRRRRDARTCYLKSNATGS